jgi:hypothetical protein
MAMAGRITEMEKPFEDETEPNPPLARTTGERGLFSHVV